jgi:hypothetical protein
MVHSRIAFPWYLNVRRAFTHYFPWWLNVSWSVKDTLGSVVAQRKQISSLKPLRLSQLNTNLKMLEVSLGGRRCMRPWASGTGKTHTMEGLITGSGLHSSTFQLNLSRSLHKIHPKHPQIPPDTCLTPPKQPLNTPPIPQKALTLSREVD